MGKKEEKAEEWQETKIDGKKEEGQKRISQTAKNGIKNTFNWLQHGYGRIFLKTFTPLS